MSGATGPEPGAAIRARRPAAGPAGRHLAQLPLPQALETAVGLVPAAAGLRLRILGPIAAWRDGRPLPLGPPRQRAVLGLLALRAGGAVHRAELIHALWGPAAPDAAVNSVQAYVGRLRQILDPGRPSRAVDGRLVSTGRSYRLQLAEDELDWLLFQALTGRATRIAADEPDKAADRYEQALALWQGTPLADLAEFHTGAAGAALHRAWAATVADYARVARGDRALSALWTLVECEPLDERAHALLMEALAGSGDPATALRVYAEIQDRLDTQLGVPPGAELARAYQRILRQEAPTPPTQTVRVGATPPVPRQLPIALPGFVGRDVALGVLDGLVKQLDGAAAPGGTVVISAIGGAAGIGKTTLAVHWAHLVADRFPDGQLYADLRGFDPMSPPLGPRDVIRSFLDALAVPADRIPAGPDAQTALYRSLLSRRQMLIVLDNARDSEQVRPLLPAGSGCLVVVTSRRELIGLAAAEGAHLVMLDMFDPADARQLLSNRLGPARVAAEQAAVTELIGLCAGLPLALSIAAGRLATRPAFPIAALLTQLRDLRQLDVLSSEKPVNDLRSLFACTYGQLSPAAARMFRLLGLHPGPDLSLPAAASLAGLPPADTRRALAELTGTHLVTELTPDRYGMHDLLRAYAAELGMRWDSPAERAVSLDRCTSHYLASMERVDRLRHPQYGPIRDAAPLPGVTPVEHTDPGEGLAWCQAERPALTALLIRAADSDPTGYPGSLLAEVWFYFHLWSHWHDMAAARRVAQTAAGPSTPPPAAPGTGLQEQARDEYRWVFERGMRRGPRLAHAYALFGMAQLLNRVGRPRTALTYAELAQDLCRDENDRGGTALALNLIARNQVFLGDPHRAAEAGHQAFQLCQELGDRAGEAFAADSLGLAATKRDDRAAAVAFGRTAADLFGRLGESDAEVEALVHLGQAYRAQGEEGAAAETWRRALSRLEDPLHPQVAIIRQLIEVTMLAGGPDNTGRG
ncbi:BTAD domain-containing putative transcriptional regulator [Micromonospora sp. CA-263727]|uniref:AfsR/SARP family transcriptional regulator n=1 Tax=Micromonospora sp. CA-263727 TaxID=3239967 RepID=UPI003D90BD85